MKRVRVAFILFTMLAAGPVLAQPPARPQRPPDPRTAVSAAAPKAAAPAKSPAQLMVDRGTAAADANRHQEAIGFYDQALKLDPKEHIALMLRGSAKAKLGDCKAAIVDLDAAEEGLIFEDTLAFVGFFNDRGDCHFDLKNYPAAIEDFSRQVRNEADDDYAWSMLGYAYSRAGKHAEALPPLRKAMELSPKTVGYVVMTGEALDRAGSFAQGLEYHRRALAMDPNFVGAHRAMALDYVSLNRLPEARTSWQTVLRLDPNNKEAPEMLGLIEAELAKGAAPSRTAANPASATRTAAAPPAAPLVVTLTEGAGPAVWKLDAGAITVTNGCADGLAKVDAYIRQRVQGGAPRDIEAYRRRAHCRFEAKDYESALGDFETVARFKGGYDDFFEVGKTQRALKQYDQAIASYQRAIALEPRKLGAYVGIGHVHEDRGAWAAANSIFDEALKINPALTTALEGKGIALYHLQNNAGALPYLTQALVGQPNSWRILVHRGSVYDRLNRPVEAIADYNRALALAPDQIQTYIAFAKVYSTRGQPQEAIRLLEAARARAPQDQSVARALQEVQLGATGRTASAPSAAAPRAAPPPPKAYPAVDPRSSLGRGIALYNATDLQPAVQALLAATRENPNDARAFIFLGAAYYKLGMSRESEEARDRALSMDPGVMALVTR